VERIVEFSRIDHEREKYRREFPPPLEASARLGALDSVFRERAACPPRQLVRSAEKGYNNGFLPERGRGVCLGNLALLPQRLSRAPTSPGISTLIRSWRLAVETVLAPVRDRMRNQFATLLTRECFFT